MNLDNESTTSALKKLHKLQMKELKQKHTVERNQLKSALAKWENGVSHQHLLGDSCCVFLLISYLFGKEIFLSLVMLCMLFITFITFERPPCMLC
jgi:hypothetical protein